MSDFFRFAFITDPQFGMDARFGANERGSDRHRLEHAITYVNENDIDLVLFGGDQINSADSAEQLDGFLECAAKLKVPYYTVPGNHDEMDPRKGPSPFFDRGGTHRFAFEHKNSYFVGANAYRLRGAFGDEIQQEERQHLEAAFEKAPTDAAHRFLIMHWPLFVDHPSEAETYWNMPNRHDLVDYLATLDLACVISGHWHQDMDSTWKGVRFITSVGTCLPLQYPEERSFKVFTVFDEGWLCRRVSAEVL